MSRFRALSLAASLGILLSALPAIAAQKRALFDNTKAETAGNADWIIDDNQPLPSPDQSTVTAATPRTYWLGAISSYGIDMVKKGFYVATLTSSYGITYGNSSNPYDLSNFDVFIVPEPNILFTSAEATAILSFVHDGGGLVAISDHSGADRNNDGYDSPMIWDALDPSHLLGVHFGVAADANNNITQTSTNVNAAASDSITHGPDGTATGLAFHNGTTMTLYPSVNPTVRGEVWMSGLSQTSTTGLMAASSYYGSGRVFFIGDSSPVDDGSAEPGNSSIYDGWGEAGATDSTLFINAAMWAARRDVAGDTQAPTVSVNAPNGGETWKAGSSHAITWSASDNVAVTSVDVDWSSTGVAPWTSLASGVANSGSFGWTVPNSPTTTARVRVRAHDAAGNLGSDSSATTFTIDRWTIVASAGPDGAIAPSGTVPVVEGASQGFTMTPSAHHHVASVLVDGGSVGAASGYTFTGVSANHTIAASFAIDTYVITATAGANGTLTPSGAVPVAYGASQGFSIRPATGYHVETLTVDGGAVAPDTTYTFAEVSAPHTLDATFAPEAFSLNVATVGTGAVAKSPDQPTYPYGTPVQVIATPGTGWAFAGWSGDLTSAADTVVVTIDAAVQLVATFVDVAPPVVRMVSPDGGERWTIGDTQTLRWTATDNAGVDSVGVEVSFHGPAGPWEPLAHGLAGVDTLSWTVPDLATDSALVRVTAWDHALNHGAAASDSMFHVAAPAGVGSGVLELAFARPTPNPARADVRFEFSLPAPAEASLEVLDVSGRRVATVARGTFPAGAHTLHWDGRDGTGALAPSGVYFARFVTAGTTVSRRFVRID